jgi:bifunctional non-homologous end joining protein LigD
MVFDLDPPAGGWPLVRSTAVELRDVLAGIGLAPFVKTSGSKGLHLVVPIVPGPGFDEVRRFAADIAGYLVRRSPDRLTLNSGREGRTDRLYLDVLRNSYGGTVVAPYSVRARDGAPVSAPLDWDEVEDPALDPMTFTIMNMPRRLERRGDPWRDIGRKAGRMDRALRLWTTFLAARAGG